MSKKVKKESHFVITPNRGSGDEETDKEVLRKKIEEDTKLFLKFKENKIEYIPIGASSLSYGLSKKQAERLGNKKKND